MEPITYGSSVPAGFHLDLPLSAHTFCLAASYAVVASAAKWWTPRCTLELIL